MVIKVTDTGIGFNQEEKEHLFDEYFQAKHKIKYQGTGRPMAARSMRKARQKD